MVVEILITLGLLILSFVIWHLGYTEYKEREWRRNNPDEFNFLRKGKDNE